MEFVSKPDPEVIARFHVYLSDHPILAQGFFLPQAEQPASTPAYIPSVPSPHARPLECWYNVRDAERAGLGKARFGWALWPLEISGQAAFVAQHHVVLEEPSGALLDITPQALLYEGNTILFWSDPNAGFDYGSDLRAPLLGHLPGAPLEFVWLNTRNEQVRTNGAWETRFDNLRLLMPHE